MLRPTSNRVILSLRRQGRHNRSLTTIGIRQEDPKRTWERRAPLTPNDIAALTFGKADVKVEVESCARRCFTDDLYAKAGAEVVSTLTPKVDLVLGIKEPPVHLVHALQRANPGKQRKYMVFSHTHKGQPYNIPLLSAFLDPHKSQTLIDYELLTAPSDSDQGALRRVAAFGWYAGAVGAGEALSMTGLALLRRGIASPLLQLSRPYTFPDIEAYKTALRQCRDYIRSSPAMKDGPIVIGLTGAGNVSTGAKEMLDAMGVEWIGIDRLTDIPNISQIYACQIPPSAYLSRKSGGGYDKAEYRSKPELYQSEFTDKIAPYLTTLINGAGWQNGYPRIMSRNDMDCLVRSGRPQKMVAIQDVACDLEGGLEFIDRHTTIDDPFFVGPGGVLISSIDILPTELPIDASTYFSSKILPYVRYLVSSPEAGSIGDTVRRAIIVKDGQLEDTHKGLMQSVEAYRSTAAKYVPVGRSSSSGRSAIPQRPTKKKVLLLGSGLVAGPAVEVISARKDIELGIASNNVREAEALAGRYPNVRAFALDVGDPAALSEAVKQADVVVSLLPAPMHVPVAQRCIEHGKHLVTASYISPEMKALDEVAKERDVILLGECGLDPGIDSMAAMRILSRVKREGKTVKSFVSWCGGLPEPGASNVPFGYKFSWSPKAVLTAAGNDARYKLDGKVRTVSGRNLLQEHFPKVDLWKGLALEGLANRDAIPYAEKYGLGEVDGLTNLFRGTLRYQGFSRLLDSFRQLSMLDTSPIQQSATWADFLLSTLSRTTGSSSSPLKTTDIIPLVRDILGDQAKETLEALEWLNILPHPSSPSMPQNLATPLDMLAHILSVRLAYGPDERDSCLLHHAFEIAPAATSLAPPYNSSAALYAPATQTRTQKVTASLLHYGTAESSSMSITVGKTLAFAALRVVDGDVRGRGVKGPYEREVWEGVLDRLEEEGVRVQEVWS